MGTASSGENARNNDSSRSATPSDSGVDASTRSAPRHRRSFFYRRGNNAHRNSNNDVEGANASPREPFTAEDGGGAAAAAVASSSSGSRNAGRPSMVDRFRDFDRKHSVVDRSARNVKRAARVALLVKRSPKYWVLEKSALKIGKVVSTRLHRQK